MAIYVSPNRAWLGRPRWDDPHTAHETATPWVCSHLGQYPGSALKATSWSHVVPRNPPIAPPAGQLCTRTTIHHCLACMRERCSLSLLLQACPLQSLGHTGSTTITILALRDAQVVVHLAGPSRM